MIATEFLVAWRRRPNRPAVGRPARSRPLATTPNERYTTTSFFAHLDFLLTVGLHDPRARWLQPHRCHFGPCPPCTMTCGVIHPGCDHPCPLYAIRHFQHIFATASDYVNEQALSRPHSAAGGIDQEADQATRLSAATAARDRHRQRDLPSMRCRGPAPVPGRAPGKVGADF